jgi:hypothetical protein
LEQSAFEEDKRLPLELVDELTKGYACRVSLSSHDPYPSSTEHTEVMLDLALLIPQQLRQALLEPLQNFNVGKVPTPSMSCALEQSVVLAYLCANHAAVTTPSCALIAPKCCGLSLMTTTAF